MKKYALKKYSIVNVKLQSSENIKKKQMVFSRKYRIIIPEGQHKLSINITP